MKVYKRINKDFSFKNYFKANNNFLWSGDSKKMLESAKNERFINLIVTSPPYNIGKSYEKNISIEQYYKEHFDFLSLAINFLKPTGSICYQLGNHINRDGYILPLDYIFHKIFTELGFKLKNRIIWTFGHGFHAQKRFSGRYETINWYVKNENYTFNLDAVRIEQKYPGKRFYKGPNKGKISSNKLGMNPSDVWVDIPHVKGNHIEKTEHPCQFPIALVIRLIRALTQENEIIFDPYMGVGSAGAAANIENRKFIGADLDHDYVLTAKKRIKGSKEGNVRYRPLEKPIYDHTNSPLSKKPKEK